MSKSYATRTVICLLAGFVLPGCYQYVPTTLEAVPAGDEVQLYVTRGGAFELAEITDIVLGPSPALRGAVQGVENGDLLLTVPVAMRQEGFHRNALLQTIRVPTGEIISVGRRELDLGKTALAVGAGAAGMGLLAFAILESFGGSNSSEVEEPDFTIFSLPIP